MESAKINVPVQGVLMRLFFHRSVSTSRNWMLLGIFLFSAFGVLDIYYYSPLHLKLAWLIRFGIVIPLLIFLYALTFFKTLKANFSMVLTCFVAVAILGINILIGLTSPEEKGYQSWYVALLLVMFWLHNSGLNSWIIIALHVFIIFCYNITAIFFQHLHIHALEVLIGNNCMILTAVLLSYISFRIIESFIAQDQKTKRELEEAVVLKEKILSVVSHDIRGPIASIKGLLNLCSIGIISTEELKANSKHLTELVDSLQGLLDTIFIWTMEEKTNSPIEKKNMSLHSIVTKVFSVFIPYAERKSIILLNQVNKSIMVSADMVTLNLILRALVSNAFKFTSQGSITIKADQTASFTIIYVEDTGSGIEKEIAEMLKKDMDNISSIYDGKGFGLAICKELIEKHGGSFTLLEGRGEGTMVCFTIPRADKAQKGKNGMKRKTILTPLSLR